MTNYQKPETIPKPSVETKPTVEKVISGEVTKPSNASRFGGFIMSTGKEAGRYILKDVLLPAVKAMLSDMTTKGVNRILYGASGRPAMAQGSAPQSRVSYSSMYSRSSQPVDRPPAVSRARNDYQNYIFASRSDVEAVIDNLANIAMSWDTVSVADLYDLIGMEQQSYTDNSWGWSDLRDARVREVRDGWVLDLPAPSYFDRGRR